MGYIYPGVFGIKRGRLFFTAGRSAIRRPNSSKTQSDASRSCARCLGTTPQTFFFFRAWGLGQQERSNRGQLALQTTPFCQQTPGVDPHFCKRFLCTPPFCSHRYTLFLKKNQNAPRPSEHCLNPYKPYPFFLMTNPLRGMDTAPLNSLHADRPVLGVADPHKGHSLVLRIHTKA